MKASEFFQVPAQRTVRRLFLTAAEQFFHGSVQKNGLQSGIFQQSGIIRLRESAGQQQERSK